MRTQSRVLIAVLTVAVFGVGFSAGLWVERARPLPAPPAPLLAEFSAQRFPSTAEVRAAVPVRAPLNRAQLAAEIERLRPQIEDYRRRIDALDAEFDRDLAAVLTPEQQKDYLAAQRRRAERMSKTAAAVAAAPEPFTDAEIEQLRQRSLFGVLWMVAPSMKLDGLVKDLKINVAQQAKAGELLRARREKFLAIVDSTPPPSITLSRLAPAAQRLATKPAK